MPELWTLLWSHRQNALHVEPLSRTLQNGIDALAQDLATDYVLLALGAKEDVEKGAEACRRTLHQRSLRRR